MSTENMTNSSTSSKGGYIKMTYDSESGVGLGRVVVFLIYF